MHSGLPFLSERIRNKKCNKLVCNLYDKKEFLLHIRALEEALNHGLVLKKVHRVIKFNQKAWLRQHIKWILN